MMSEASYQRICLICLEPTNEPGVMMHDECAERETGKHWEHLKEQAFWNQRVLHHGRIRDLIRSVAEYDEVYAKQLTMDIVIYGRDFRRRIAKNIDERNAWREYRGEKPIPIPEMLQVAEPDY